MKYFRKKKIVGFGSKDIEAAVELKRQLEEQDKAKLQHAANKKRLAELEAKGLLEYRKRTTSSSSDSSNYDTPPGSPAAAATKEKGKLKKNPKKTFILNSIQGMSYINST